MEKNKTSRNITSLEVNNKGGMFERWGSMEYEEGVYYVNISGNLCPMPKNPKDMEDVYSEILQEEKDLR